MFESRRKFLRFLKKKERGQSHEIGGFARSLYSRVGQFLEFEITVCGSCKMSKKN